MSAFALRLAILPSILLLLFVVGKNKQRRNPTSLLVWLAVLGAVSAIPAVIVEILGSGLLYMLGLGPSSAMYNFVECFFIVAMIEELGKFLGMLLMTWKNKNFDHSYDGVIYGVCSSLGFATLENVIYVFQGGIGTGIMRAVSAVPLHCACGVVMGFLYAKAREDANNGESAFGNLLLAYVCPLGIHGLYDFVLSVEDTSVLLCIAVLALVIILMFLLITHAAKEDHIIAVQPIWTAPYNFRYMPMRGCQSNHYNQPGGYGTQPNTYGQPGGYGAQPNTYGQPGGYRAQPNTYGQPGGYGAQPNTYGQPGSYGTQPNTYGQPGSYGAHPNTYGQPGGYGAQSNTYGQPGGYGAQLNIYGQFGHTDTYGQTGNYGTQPDNRR